MSDNQRYYDVYSVMAEVAQPLAFEDRVAVDAVVAAVREDAYRYYSQEIREVRQLSLEHGRQAAARDIRAAIDDEHYDFAWVDGMHNAARIAEGADDDTR